MKRIPEIKIEDYDYELSEDRIAQFPVQERDGSKLLIYNKGMVTRDLFRNISEYIPERSVLVFNNARVIRARLHFRKHTGAMIEVLCLEPLQPADYERAFNSSGPVEWKCLIGNLKKWKSGMISSSFKHKEKEYILSAERIHAEGDAWRVRFQWNGNELSFGEVLESAGRIPLPPYVRREDLEQDYIRYQTVYSKNEGSVAAPTAGLHFTEDVLYKISGKEIRRVELTLHIGAGTFKPVKSEDISLHEMHREHFLVTRQNLEAILEGLGRIIAVGTTSVRTLESLYWLGIMAMKDKRIIDNDPMVRQWEWAETASGISNSESLGFLVSLMKETKIDYLTASTGLMIIPGYRFRMINGMITNFHQPRSTLLLLISAWTGDNWKKIYRYAMDNGFRFLSYGDASILI